MSDAHLDIGLAALVLAFLGAKAQCVNCREKLLLTGDGVKGMEEHDCNSPEPRLIDILREESK